MRRAGVVVAFLSMVLLSGCGAKRQDAYSADTGAGRGMAGEGLEERAHSFWNQREDADNLRAALGLYEEVVQDEPERRDILERLAEGYYLLGYGYLTDEKDVLEAYDAGAKWGERILALSPDFRTRVASGEDDYKALDVTTIDDVPGIYWAYACLGKWSVLKGFTTVLRYKNKLKAFIDRVAELGPEYYYGAADRGLGAFFAKAPSFAGGDLDVAIQHFERSLEIAPDYLGTKVLMAEYVAYKQQDREMFERLLTEVVEADPKVIPEIVAIQLIEQRRARELLAEIDEWF